MTDQTLRQTILIVDDNPVALSALRQVLDGAGYRTLEARTFRDGLRLLRTAAPDLLLTEIRLGEFNGLQFLATDWRRTPTVVVTDFPDPVIEADARRLGAEYVLKPIVPDELLRLIERVIGGPLASQRVLSAVRRWERKHVSHSLSARIEDLPARILDISYGGLCFEIAQDPEGAMPPSFDVSLPQSTLSIHADLVWSSRTGDQNLVCGAVVSEADQFAVRGWRELVDTVA